MKKIFSMLIIFAVACVANAADIDALTKKANAGDAQAMYELAMAYDGMNDIKKAVEWYEKAANKGHDEAMNELGLLYYYGVDGVLAEDHVKGCMYLYTTTVDAAAYPCTQLRDENENKRALEEAAKLKKSLGR